jgi:hypothetical protein
VSSQAEQDRALEEMAIQSIMATEDQRRFMWRNLEQSGVLVDNYDENPYNHARNAGARSQGLWLQNELMTAAPAMYFKMIKENANE